jgi:hypothetical protein
VLCPKILLRSSSARNISENEDLLGESEVDQEEAHTPKEMVFNRDVLPSSDKKYE